MNKIMGHEKKKVLKNDRRAQKTTHRKCCPLMMKIESQVSITYCLFKSAWKFFPLKKY